MMSIELQTGKKHARDADANSVGSRSWDWPVGN